MPQLLLALHPRLRAAHLPAAQGPLQARIRRLDQRLNHLVYLLYGLSYAEAQAVEPGLALAADPTDPARAADHARWLRAWLNQRARPRPAYETTRYHRLRAQAAGLQAEAAALAAALAPGSLAN